VNPAGLLALFFMIALSVGFFAQAGMPAAGDLAGLPYLREGRSRMASTHSPDGGDAVSIPAGERKDLVTIEGPAVIENVWMTLLPDDPAALRGVVLRFYWDDEPNPSVQAPFGDFFGLGFGRYATYSSLPLGVTSGGFYCYFPMPFASSARLEVENQYSAAVTLFCHIRYRELPRLPDDVAYFHALYRHEKEPKLGEPYTVLEASGEGHYAGVSMSMQDPFQPAGLNFLEGDELITLDGEEEASYRGTGTEEYFQGGLYFRDGPFAAPYHGCPVRDIDAGRVTAYRWHIPDAVSFSTDIAVRIEHGQTYNAAKADYSSVAFWYQREPHAPVPEIEPAAERGPITPLPRFKIAGAVEAEDFAPGATYYMSTYRYDWSNHLAKLYAWEREGESVVYPFTVEEDGEYSLQANLVPSSSCGKIAVSVDDVPLSNTYDGFSSTGLDNYLLCRNAPSGLFEFGRAKLEEGRHTVRFQSAGKNPQARGYFMLLDCFVAKKIEE
jgi:hypothetical protein